MPEMPTSQSVGFSLALSSLLSWIEDWQGQGKADSSPLFVALRTYI